MSLKITLITPPDIYQNNNYSFLFCNLTEEEQELSSEWLGKVDSDLNINIYYYNNDRKIDWLLLAYASADYIYLNVDKSKDESGLLLGYMLSKNKSFFSSNEPALVDVYKKINLNAVSGVIEFLERVLGERK